MNKKTFLVVSAIILFTLIGGAFYGGMVYGKSQNLRSGFPANFAGNNQGNRVVGNSGGFISGGILSKDSNSITVQLPNNSGSKIIFYSDSTQIAKSTQGTKEDLLVGSSVSVTGTTNSDGSVTAKSIQIRPDNQINQELPKPEK